MESIRLAIPSTQLTIPLGQTKILSDGTPVRRFKRFGIQIGKIYKKVTSKGTQVIDASREQCDHWLSMWNACKDDGLPIKATKNHENWRNATSAMGDVVDIAEEDGWLAVTLDMRGQENINIAESNKDVSIETWPEIVDGKGNTLRDFICAVTFTTIPVVVGQPIAASMADEDEPFRLSQEQNMCTRLYGAIAKLSGVKHEDINESNAHEHIERHLSLCTGLRESKLALETELAGLKAENLKLSAEDKPDTRYLSLSIRAAEGPIDRLVTGGILDVATGAGVKKLLFGEKTEKGRTFSPIALSMGDEDEALVDLAEKFAKLLESNKPVKTGETTPGQVLRLSREVPDETGTPAAKTIKSPWTGKDVAVSA